MLKYKEVNAWHLFQAKKFITTFTTLLPKGSKNLNFYENKRITNMTSFKSLFIPYYNLVALKTQ